MARVVDSATNATKIWSSSIISLNQTVEKIHYNSKNARKLVNAVNKSKIPWTRLSSPLFSRNSMGPETYTDLTHLNLIMGLAPMLPEIRGGHQSSIVEPDRGLLQDLMVPMGLQDLL